MKLGDLVQWVHADCSEDRAPGIVIKTSVDMWEEETIPSGVEILWCDGEIEVYTEDELEVISEAV